MTTTEVRPFSYRGSKWKVAPDVWQLLGDSGVYCEPFCGSLAMLLSRPDSDRNVPVEHVGDIDCLLINFWLAIKNDPESVAHHYIAPASQVLLESRHQYLRGQRKLVKQKILDNYKWYDAELAGIWAWGQGLSVDNWCFDRAYSSPWWPTKTMSAIRQQSEEQLTEYFSRLSVRLRNVGIHCSDWLSTIEKGLARIRGPVAVFVDPPYSSRAGRQSGLYAEDSLTVSQSAAEWCLSYGKEYAIAFCGHEGTHSFPRSWKCGRWKSDGSSKRGHLERIWFSPKCALQKL